MTAAQRCAAFFVHARWVLDFPHEWNSTRVVRTQQQNPNCSISPAFLPNNQENPKLDRNRFASLIVGYCKLCGIDSPMDIVHGAPVETDGVLFSLIHSDRVNPRMLLIFSDVGDPPQDGDADAYYAILSKNFVFGARRGPVFAISPESGRLLLIQAEDLAELTPTLLADRLEELAKHARQWRENPFGAEQEAAGGLATTAHARPGWVNGISRSSTRG
jgi:hypothetical protein